MRCVVAAMLGALVAACNHGGGAVSLRWRIVDLNTGARFDPRTVGGTNGVCACPAPNEPDRPDNCSPEYGWRVSRIAIDLVDQATLMPPVLADGGESKLQFDCDKREETTPFVIPPGSYAVRITAMNPSGESTCVAGYTPPAVPRTIRQGDIVSLDVVEIGVPTSNCP